MRRTHLLGCAAVVGLALLGVMLTGGGAGSIAFLVAAVLCPVAMVTAVWLLMGGRPPAPSPVRRDGATVTDGTGGDGRVPVAARPGRGTRPGARRSR